MRLPFVTPDPHAHLEAGKRMIDESDALDLLTPELLGGAVKTIELPDGAVITGRGLRDGTLVEPHPDYGVYLQPKPVDVPWPHDWIDWPDFRLPRDHDAAIAMIRSLHARALSGEKVEVACSGGVGRTGTVISCLAVLAGVPAAEAVAWTRAHYHRRAVETPWQKRWVRNFPG